MAATRPAGGTLVPVGWRTGRCWRSSLFPILFVVSAAINPLGTLASTDLLPTGASLGNFADLFDRDAAVRPLVPQLAAHRAAVVVRQRVPVGVRRVRLQPDALPRPAGRAAGAAADPDVPAVPGHRDDLPDLHARSPSCWPAFGFNTAVGAACCSTWAARSGVNTWLMKGFLDTVPKELDESATVDGATPRADLLPDHPAAGRADPGGHRRCWPSSAPSTSSSWPTCSCATGRVQDPRRRHVRHDRRGPAQRQLRHVRRRHAAHRDPDRAASSSSCSGTSSPGSPPARSRDEVSCASWRAAPRRLRPVRLRPGARARRDGDVFGCGRRGPPGSTRRARTRPHRTASRASPRRRTLGPRAVRRTTSGGGPRSTVAQPGHPLPVPARTPARPPVADRGRARRPRRARRDATSGWSATPRRRPGCATRSSTRSSPTGSPARPRPTRRPLPDWALPRDWDTTRSSAAGPADAAPVLRRRPRRHRRAPGPRRRRSASTPST